MPEAVNPYESPRKRSETPALDRPLVAWRGIAGLLLAFAIVWCLGFLILFSWDRSWQQLIAIIPVAIAAVGYCWRIVGPCSPNVRRVIWGYSLLTQGVLSIWMASGLAMPMGTVIFLWCLVPTVASFLGLAFDYREPADLPIHS